MQTSSTEESGEQKNHSLPEPADQTQVSAPIVPSPPTQGGETDPVTIGKYPVIRKLGSGGMANVYLAINPADHSEVAIKVHLESMESNPHLVERFQKETRLLAEINHPHVTNLLEAGEYQQKLYLAMEYVPGIDLKQLLRLQKRLPEKAALKIIRDIADALSFAHQKGIVHRDIKPANVLLGDFTNTTESGADTFCKMISDDQHPIVKLTDFGLARHMNQSESLALTKTGAMLGTPYYLAPEQCMDTAPIQPTTDIYSLGITLFELLAGRPPFLAQDSVKLITMHCFEQPPDLKKLNPEVSDAVAALVERCLQKRPEARFADGEHLRDEIERILAGELTPVPQHPLIPASKTSLMEASWEWELSCTPEQLWPFVSNTERINNAIGLPPVEYTTGRDEHGAISKTGSFRLGWARLEWREHPFEWIEGKRLGVIREFTTGPFQWFSSVVQLHPLPQGGTRLVHQVKIAPRGLLGRLLAFLEVNVNGRKKLNLIYPRIDQIISKQNYQQAQLDPFQVSAPVKKRIQSRLSERISQIQQQGADDTCTKVLEKFINTAAAQEIARIRPLALADAVDCQREPLTETCLHACTQRVLQLHWDILCPTCRISTTVRDTLADIKKHEYCEACDLDFEVDFQNAIELIFQVHPEIRKSDLSTYCIGGPEHAPHVVSQLKLQSGEILELDLELDSGSYTIRGPQLPYTIPVCISSESPINTLRLNLSTGDQKQSLIPLSPGRQRLILKNEYNIPILLRLERSIRKNDVLTAADASRIELFRKLFPEQVLSSQQLMDFSTCTILGAQIAGVEELFSLSGDATALQKIEAEMKYLRQLAELHGGEIAKAQEDRTLIIFSDSTHAIQLAAKLLERSANAKDALPLGLALHRGNALAKTMNGKIDYFGKAVTSTGILLQRAAAHSLLLSDECQTDKDLILALNEANLTAYENAGSYRNPRQSMEVQ